MGGWVCARARECGCVRARTRVHEYKKDYNKDYVEKFNLLQVLSDVTVTYCFALVMIFIV
jgi:hypothetical protein